MHYILFSLFSQAWFNVFCKIIKVQRCLTIREKIFCGLFPIFFSWMAEFLIYCKQALPPLNFFAKRHLQNISQDVVSHCILWNILYTKYNFCLKKLLTFSYSNSLFPTMSLHRSKCFEPSIESSVKYFANFSNFSINSENDTKTIFYRKHYLSLSTKT